MKPVLIALLLVGPAPAGADVIDLAGGQRVEGTDVRASPDHVTVRVGGQTLIFPRAQVRAVHFGPAPDPCPPAEPRR
jgi:hypothetical protein